MQRSKSDTNTLIGHKIKSLRVERNMTLENLAESSGLSIMV